jgi:predicted aspartyl protease
MMLNLLIVALAAQFAAVSVDVNEQGIPFRFVRDNLMVIPVFLNGRGPYQFLVDTGATHSILSSSVAEQLNVVGGRTGSLITAAGAVPVTIGTIDIVQIGSVRIYKTQIAVTSLELFRTLHVDGVLGADYLKQFKISIDYTNQVLTLQR